MKSRALVLMLVALSVLTACSDDERRQGHSDAERPADRGVHGHRTSPAHAHADRHERRAGDRDPHAPGQTPDHAGRDGDGDPDALGGYRRIADDRRRVRLSR